MKPISQRLILQPWTEEMVEGETNKAGTFTMPPRILYRYFRCDRALDAIKTENLYFASPLNFNDPLDMNEHLIDFKYDEEKLGKWYDRLSEFKHMGPKENFVRSKSPGLYSFVRKMFVDLRKQSGVCCFTSNPDNALMWSHYTDSHKGVVLGFNIMPVMQGGQFFIQSVKYSEEIVPRSYFDGNEEVLQHLILTKSSVWNYEKEYRAYHYSQNGLIQFNKACLKEVVFGYHTSNEKRQETLTAIRKGGYRGVTIKEVVLDKASFRFVTREVKTIR